MGQGGGRAAESTSELLEDKLVFITYIELHLICQHGLRAVIKLIYNLQGRN